AALTGHLVFSTLHTNNAATCLPRLLDMGVEPFLIASTVRVVVGQRLVRRLCVDCREEFKPDDTLLKQLEKSFNIEANGGIKQIHELEQAALDGGIGKGNSGKSKVATDELSSTASTITKLYKAHDDGCESCNHSGYKGRIGIYEVLGNSEEVQKLIVGSSTSEIIQAKAITEGMLTMQLDGLVKALRGQTTIEEILRVTAQE
ncbi:MAG TPA: ATPase, T2SS/T4P/T4SS family, partial [Patescibacteria group bacterium]|nr:ATPase, T2SS/T4P/T4SS family [Patescibacteria group bacterium]